MELNMPNIKGSLFISWVKAVRADKQGMLLKLNETDRKILETKLYPSSWYPFETYRNIVEIVCRKFAKNDEKIIYDWGYQSSDEIVGKIYKHIIVDGSPSKTVASFASTKGSLFDFGSMVASETNDKTIHFTVSGFPDNFEALYHLIRGWTAKLITFSGAKNVESVYLKKTWTGDPETVIEYTWS
jgi:hypothetical protein